MILKSRALLVSVVVVISAMLSAPVSAQSTDGGWQYLVQPYLMIPNMRGDIGLGTLPPVHIDEGPDDIFSNLQMGAMFYLEASNDRWAFTSDTIYMDLGADIDKRGLITGGEASAAQTAWEVSALRRLSPWFELGVAATYNRIDSDLRINTLGGGTLNGGMTEDWVDPSVVMRATFPLSEKWYVQGRGNIGGWGIGSDSFWQVQADIGYRHSTRTSFTFGYRYISVDYDDGTGSERFMYDVDSFGPTIKVGFTF